MQSLRFTIVFALLLAQCCLYAQQGAWSYHHYTTEDGLSNDMVFSLAKDKRGFLWVGTKSGLNRFDGRSFRQFFHQPGIQNCLPDNLIYGLCLDPQGYLWVSTYRGICRLDTDRLHFERVPMPGVKLDQDSWFGAVSFDKNGTGWVCGLDSLFAIDPKTMQCKGFATGRTAAGFNDTHLDGKGRFWMTTGGYLYCFDTHHKTMKVYVDKDQNPSIFSALILDIAETQDGELFFSSATNRVYRYDPSLDKILPYPKEFDTNMEYLVPDRDAAGNSFFWSGGNNRTIGVFYPKNGGFNPIELDPWGSDGEGDFLIFNAMKDPGQDGLLWFATVAGLTRVWSSPLRFDTEKLVGIKKPGLEYLSIHSLAKNRLDPLGNSYFILCLPRALYEWDKSAKKSRLLVQSDFPEIANLIGVMQQDSKGMVWLSDKGQLKRYDPRTGSVRVWKGKEFPLPPNRGINAMLEDRDGRLWFASSIRKMLLYKPETSRFDTLPIPFPHDPEIVTTIWQMEEDSAGNLWLLTRESIYRWNPKTNAFKGFSLKINGNNADINALLIDKKGRFWASTSEGFCELDYDGNILQLYQQGTGLKSEYIGQLVDDDMGRIWLCSDNLLHCFNPSTKSFTYFGKTDGLQSNAIELFMTKSDDGEILIGFDNAFVHFDPMQLRLNLTPPPVAVTSLRVMKEERNPAGPVVLRPGETFLSVEFAALDFNPAKRNQYAYRLDGFDEDWVYTDRPVATYTNLDGGNYTLHLKAANSEGTWNEEGISLPVKVIPPLRKRWYFKLFLVLFGGAILFGIWWMRRQQRHRLETFRESLARDLHDEMGSTLSSIRFFSEFASQQVGDDKPQVTPVLQRIGQSASALSESMQDIIWAMKTKNDQLGDLAARMTEFGLRLMEARGIAFKTHIGEEAHGQHLGPELRRNVYLIFKEAMNNAAKYSEASEVRLDLSLQKGLLTMKISDNGKGFEQGGERSPLGAGGSGGNGLKNMRQRAADVGGRLEVEAKLGEGTSVELKVSV